MTVDDITSNTSSSFIQAAQAPSNITIIPSGKRSYLSLYVLYPILDVLTRTYSAIVNSSGTYLGMAGIRPLEWRKAKFKRTVRTKVAIIGAGVAGLTCAKELLRNGVKDFVIVDASDGQLQSECVD